MGNRAHVIFVDVDGDIGPAVYLHWNGGPESIYGFLDELMFRGVRRDTSYATARFAQIIGEYFGSTGSQDSLGVTNGPEAITPEALAPFDHGDNGVYVIQWGEDARWTMRRFTKPWRAPAGDEPILREWKKDEVEREGLAAMQHAYHEEFRAFFAVCREANREAHLKPESVT